MANINISDLHSAGYDLFSDSELFINDLSEEELNIQGGFISRPWFSPYCRPIPTPRPIYPPIRILTVQIEKRG
ncbi:hypothetical protein [Dendronalium sp. ChiSLP03b]|uniref:hypothetical protein n=1 Tax=Dendronalium sp. ChiSLP03b TaxID=3075381 RepID=UPI002AD2F0C1|nr:hypothetical protein [Dendronalium sp. ChiSLP03b]MDZ8206820.1 hypothetical protein [Dendronalium sp. ChiSLP03b]